MGSEHLRGERRATDAGEQARAPRTGRPGRPRRVVVQARLSVGPAGDRYEQEADRVAAAVVRDLQHPPAPFDESADVTDRPTAHRLVRADQRSQAAGGPTDVARRVSRIQRGLGPAVVGVAGGELDADTDAALHSARQGGRPLDDSLRRSMEGSFGADFSRVRVHTDRAADELNGRIQATAATVGPDIFFSRGAYDPATRSGQSLVAHELTHVVQQGAAGPAAPSPHGPRVDRHVIDRPARTGRDVVQRLRLTEANRDIAEDQMTLKTEYFLARTEGRSADLAAIAKLQSSSAVRPDALMTAELPDSVVELMSDEIAAFGDDEIAIGIFMQFGQALANEFHAAYKPGANPAIPASLMGDLRAVGGLVLRAEKYRESAGGQNGMIYEFAVPGFERVVLGEWHVHWEAKKRAGNPGWKRGKNGVKVSTGDEMRRVLGDRWGVVKSTGGGNWV
jgi:hypothetical protein